MTGMAYAAAAGEFFGAIKEIASLVPQFDERKKNMIEKETRKLSEIEAAFTKAAVEFDFDSNADELLGLSDALKKQKVLLEKLYILYASEIKK